MLNTSSLIIPMCIIYDCYNTRRIDGLYVWFYATRQTKAVSPLSHPCWYNIYPIYPNMCALWNRFRKAFILRHCCSSVFCTLYFKSHRIHQYPHLRSYPIILMKILNFVTFLFIKFLRLNRINYVNFVHCVQIIIRKKVVVFIYDNILYSCLHLHESYA